MDISIGGEHGKFVVMVIKLCVVNGSWEGEV